MGLNQVLIQQLTHQPAIHQARITAVAQQTPRHLTAAIVAPKLTVIQVTKMGNIQANHRTHRTVLSLPVITLRTQTRVKINLVNLQTAKTTTSLQAKTQQP